MKRCSQCEFVYEDEQGVCDMDGSELVYEPTLYPPPSNATTTSPLKFRSRSFILTAAATLIMGSVLAVGFYGVTNRSEPPTSAVTPVASESAPPVVDEPAVTATPAEESTEAASEANVNAGDTDAKSRNAATTSAPAKPAGSRTTTTRTSTKPASAQPKKGDSKVGGLLKKTGRILKKPFKF
ncbi:MAG TPA: hypothetical protein VJM12_12830 [Pyrinomonadaceae bacterium]|nr:hypothetical protein [Pyrinomonadaceae bacterium]